MPWKHNHIGKVVKIDIEGLKRRWSSSWSNLASEHARDLLLVSMGRLDLKEVRTHAVEVCTHRQGCRRCARRVWDLCKRCARGLLVGVWYVCEWCVGGVREVLRRCA